MKNKVLVTGTGRAGTTFLMIIFTHLGLSTGSTPDNMSKRILDKPGQCNSGIEDLHDIFGSYIIKSPFFTQIEELSKISKKVNIDMVYFPIRNYQDCVMSRKRYEATNIGKWPTLEFHHKIVAEYLRYSTKHDIPTTYIDFDRMVTDKQYLFKKLSFVLKDISFEQFCIAYDKSTKHQKNKP